jgi:serine/threonine protein phosphatase PrpC
MALAKQLRLDPAQLTDVGRKREHNEDNMAYVIPKDPQVMAMKGALFIVADGMGGHAAGEVASEIAVDTVSNAYYMDDNEDVMTPLLQAIKRANLAIHQRAAENLLRSGMGTTCVAAVLRGNMGYIANVGDSRAYLVRGSHVKQITQDHSWVAEQVRAGLLTEDQARTHAQRNVITRCLGTQPDVEVDVFLEPLQENDCLVLCTDGLSGLLSDEEVMRIVDQSVPQESVYHLVERANENGGPDNITAIVVRVQEVGMEPPGARSPVRVGGREISEENTGAFNMLASSPMPFITNNGDVRVSSSPLQLSSGLLASPDTITAPQPALGTHRRSRLFFPTLFMIFLILAALGGGGVFYFVHLNQNTAIAQMLDNANSLISQARSDTDANPTKALQELSTAQSKLNALPKTQALDSSQTSRINSLQSLMAAQVKTTIGQYNNLNHIATLPCNATTINQVMVTDPNTQPLNIVAVHSAKGTGTAQFALGKDGSVYHIDELQDQFHLVSSLPKLATSNSTSSYISIASGGSQLFALAQQSKNGVPNGYMLALYTLDQTGKLTQPVSAPIANTSDGYVPMLITALGNNVYVVLSNTNQNQGRIVKYAPDGKNHLVPSGPFPFSFSPSIVSVTTFSNQFFMLLADGEVKSLPLTASAINPLALPIPVLTSFSIPTPLPITGSDNKTPTVVPTVATVSQKGNSPLIVSTATILASGEVNGAPHLYIGDSTNHRLLDLEILPASATSTPAVTGTPTGASLIMQLDQQFASSQLLNVVKSIAVDPQAQGANINILGQNSSQLNLVSVSPGLQTKCASGS